MRANRPRRLVSTSTERPSITAPNPHVRGRSLLLASPDLHGSVCECCWRRLCFTKLKEEEGIACILVTHDMAFAAKAADRIAYFESGVIAEEGDPQKLLFDPESEGLRNFVAAVRF